MKLPARARQEQQGGADQLVRLAEAVHRRAGA